MPPRKTNDILTNVEYTLQTAKMGIINLKSENPNFMVPGLHNIIVFGRAVTNVLQQLTSTEDNFEAWYEKYRREMKNDPLLKYFYDLRSKILKEGELGVSTDTFVRSFMPDVDLQRFPKPPNAKSFFIGDRYGGSGWKVEYLDGTIEKYYVDLPEDIGKVSLKFKIKPPDIHLGKKIKDSSIEALAELYIKYLQEMVNDARITFQDV